MKFHFSHLYFQGKAVSVGHGSGRAAARHGAGVFGSVWMSVVVEMLMCIS